MASSSSAAGTSLHGSIVTEKLAKGNHGMWKAQVRVAIRGAHLQGYLTGAAKAPDAEIVVKIDGKEVKQPI